MRNSLWIVVTVILLCLLVYAFSQKRTTSSDVKREFGEAFKTTGKAIDDNVHDGAKKVERNVESNS
jgi:hypothetical protein